MISTIFEIISGLLSLLNISFTRKAKIEKAFLDFIARYDADVKKNVKIKKRYDELLSELRKKQD